MKTQKGALKRAKILAAAAKVFRQKGYSETTLADVAREAGTFAGSLYYYFASKDHLVEEVMNLGTLNVTEIVERTVNDLPADTGKLERIRLALQVHLKYTLARDDFAMAYWKMLDHIPAEIRDRHVVKPRAYGHFWERLIRDAQDAGEVDPQVDARVASLLLLGSTLYALDWYREDGRQSIAEIGDLLFRMTFQGIARDEPMVVDKNCNLR